MLGATVLLRSDAPEPIVVLKKCGSAKLRFVTSNGEPREGAHAMHKIVVTPGVMQYSEDVVAGALAADEDFVANHDFVNYTIQPRRRAETIVTIVLISLPPTAGLLLRTD